MPTAAYYTLGCKVNQYETEQIRTALESAGFRTVPFSSKADVYVINTCAVTATAESKSRAAIRKAHRLNPDACLVVTGCYVEIQPNVISAIEGVDLVVGNRDKATIADRIINHFCLWKGSEVVFDALITRQANNKQSGQTLPRTRTRAVVKVQDGCDHFCSYCIVPYARPVRQCRPLEEVLEEVRLLADYGYREVVLTGIRLGSYKHGDQSLAELVKQAAQIQGIERIRLSSIEPWEIDEQLIETFQHPKVCRHLHIPLQSGDNEILALMNRPYRAEEYLSLVEVIRDSTPGIGITTDVIVGFPGETEKAFRNTCETVRSAGFSRLHVFRYSPRRLTPAADLPNQVPEAVKKERAMILAEIGRECARTFAQQWIGATLPVLAENRLSICHCAEFAEEVLMNKGLVLLRGFTDNYIEVTFAGRPSSAGTVVSVRITDVEDSGRAVGTAEESTSRQDSRITSSFAASTAREVVTQNSSQKGG